MVYSDENTNVDTSREVNKRVIGSETLGIWDHSGVEPDGLLIMLCVLIKERPWYLESIKKQSPVDHWLSAHLIALVIARQGRFAVGEHRHTGK